MNPSVYCIITNSSRYIRHHILEEGYTTTRHPPVSYDLMIFVLYKKRCTKIAKANVEEVQGEIICILGLYDEVSKI